MALTHLATDVNLEGGWSGLWTAITNALPGITTLLTIVGVCLVAGAIIGFIMERRKGGGGFGGGQGSSKLWWTLAGGAVLAGTNTVMPLLLKLADAVINFGIGVLGSV